MSSQTPPPSPRPRLTLAGDLTGPHPKILNVDDLCARREQARRDGLTLVQCHGCFDIVHPGHIRHLRHAKAQGDLLLVSITGDAGIAKGTGRPLIPEELRAENLAALDFVDFVHVDPHPTAGALLDRVRPDVYVKGREYEFNSDARFLAERDTVERHGGRVFFSSGDVVFSSTALIAAIENSVDPYHARLRELLARPDLDGVELAGLIGRFRNRRVLVVGETVTDTYVLCDQPEIAGEGPAMKLRPVERRSYDGGAAIIARHLAAMGAHPVLVTGLPRAAEADDLRARLAADGVDVRAVEIDGLIPERQRFLVGAQKVMELDLVQRIELDSTRREEFLAVVTSALGPESDHPFDAAIIADEALGLLPAGILPRLCAAIRPRSTILSASVSGRRANLRHMRGLDLVLSSEHDLRDAYRLFDEGLSMVTWRTLNELRSRGAMVTMGHDGLIAFSRLDEPSAPSPRESDAWRTRCKAEHVPALSGQTIDSLGCAGATLAAATLALGSGAALTPAAFLGSIAAAVQAQRLGNTVVSASDLRHGVARLHTAHLTFAPAEVIRARVGRPVEVRAS